MKQFIKILIFNIVILAGIEIFFRFSGLAPEKSFFISSEDSNKVVTNIKHFDPVNNFAINKTKIAKKKPAQTKRIFMLGGSTMAGLHYNPHASIPKFLDLILKDTLPTENIEVINAGVGGIGSKTVLEIFKEIRHYEPDLMIVYTGQNEFLENNIQKLILEKETPAKAKVINILSSSATLAWMKKVSQKNRKMEPPPLITTDTMIAKPFFGEVFAEVVTNYKSNLDEMAALANQNNIPLMFITPFSNLKDWDPNHSYFSKEVDESKVKKWQRYILKAKKIIDEENQAKHAEAERLLAEASVINGQVAELQFQKARLHAWQGQWKEAQKAYALARSLDGRPWRNLSEFAPIVRKKAHDHKTFLFDAQKSLASRTKHNLIGDDWTIDNCHPNIKGQFLIARGIAATLMKNESLSKKNNWKLEKIKPYEDYFKVLIPNNQVLAQTFYRTGNYLLAWVGLRYDGRARLEKTIRAFDEAIKANQEDAKALYAKGLVLKLKGSEAASKSEELIKKAKALNANIEEESKALVRTVNQLQAHQKTQNKTQLAQQN